MRGWKTMRRDLLAVCIVSTFSFITSFDSAVMAKQVLKDGTDVQLKFAQDLTSKTAAEGDPVSLVLDQDLKLGDVVVIKAGAKAVGTITHSKKAGMMGKAGELNMRLEY